MRRQVYGYIEEGGEHTLGIKFSSKSIPDSTWGTTAESMRLAFAIATWTIEERDSYLPSDQDDLPIVHCHCLSFCLKIDQSFLPHSCPEGWETRLKMHRENTGAPRLKHFRTSG